MFSKICSWHQQLPMDLVEAMYSRVKWSTTQAIVCRFHKISGTSHKWYIKVRTSNLHKKYFADIVTLITHINTLRPRQNGRHLADDPFKRIFLNESLRIAITISPNFVPKGQINNIPTLVQVMAWHRPGYKPLSEPMMVRLPTHICVTWPQWVKPFRVIFLAMKIASVNKSMYFLHWPTLAMYQIWC